jgi:hypothetical protein
MLCEPLLNDEWEAVACRYGAGIRSEKRAQCSREAGAFSELVERVSGPGCQPHGDVAEKNIARGTRKRYICSIQPRVLNEVQQ